VIDPFCDGAKGHQEENTGSDKRMIALIPNVSSGFQMRCHFAVVGSLMLSGRGVAVVNFDILLS